MAREFARTDRVGAQMQRELAELLRSAGLVASNSEAFRLIAQGGVRIDGERVSDRALVVPAGTEHLFQVGKRRLARIRLAAPKKISE